MNWNKVFYVAKRDFIATVTTRGFIIALVLPVVMFFLFTSVLPKAFNGMPGLTGPDKSGVIAVIDPTGEITPELSSYMRNVRGEPEGAVPHYAVAALRPDADPETEKETLRTSRWSERMSLVVVARDAIKPGRDGRYGGFILYVQRILSNREQQEIIDGVQHAIVLARAKASGLNPSQISDIATVPRPRPEIVGDQSNNPFGADVNRGLPFVLVILLLLSIMSSGQQLLTTTVEEKSTRTIEVLLAALSPMELMTGKILGQMSVGFLVLALYSSVGVAALVSMAMVGLVNVKILIFLFVFFFITDLFVASLMAAIGSAVTEFREAQSLMMPVTLLLMSPWFVLQPILRDPSSTFARVLSMVPPFSGYVSLVRMAAGAGPAWWELTVAIAGGLALAAATTWFAARVFRVGLLMYGKPPNFATLIRWARQG